MRNPASQARDVLPSRVATLVYSYVPPISKRSESEPPRTAQATQVRKARRQCARREDRHRAVVRPAAAVVSDVQVPVTVEYEGGWTRDPVRQRPEQRGTSRRVHRDRHADAVKAAVVRNVEIIGSIERQRQRAINPVTFLGDGANRLVAVRSVDRDIRILGQSRL